jgi:CheY-like chemotaxis protein
MTANAMTEDRKKCQEVGIDEYLTKPFDPNQLYRVINQLSLQIEELRDVGTDELSQDE